MSLDIEIFASENIQSEDFIVFTDISRAFCTLIRLLEEEDNGELSQISKLTQVDISVIRKMSTWSIWQRQYSGFKTKAEEEKFINEYIIACDNSWQDIDLARTCFTSLHTELMKNLSFYSLIDYRLEWLSTYEYFQDFDKNISFDGRMMHKNFGWDLRNIIDFLNSAKEKKMKHVRFQIN